MNTKSFNKSKNKKAIATVALVSALVLCTMAVAPAMAYYNFDGFPVITRTSGTVDGGVFHDSEGWASSRTLTLNTDVPSGTVKYAYLYTGTWCGTPDSTGWVNVTFNGNAGGVFDCDGNELGPINIKGNADTNPNVWCSGYGKSWWYYNVTDLVIPGTTNTATNSKINGSIDGRVYGIALVVVYEGGDNPKHIQYWVNDGSDGLNYQTPHNTGTTDFPGTVTGSVTDANLTMVHLTAYSPICSNCLKFNDNLLDTSCVNTNAFDMHTWDVTNYVAPSANDAWFSRGDDPYANVCNAILTVEVEVADTTPPYTDGHDPAKGATDVPPDTNVVVHVKDDGKGVDQNTIMMTVGGITVTPTTITGTPNDYLLTYGPPTDFDYGQVVDVTVNAADLNATPNVMSTDSYSFTIKELKTSTPFFISGWVNNSIGDSVNNPLVTITNLNRPEIEPFIAENDTSINYYQVLTSSENVSAGDVLHKYARDSYGNVFEENHTVTEGEMNAGGFEQNITILYPYIDLVVTDINAYHNDTRCMPWFNLSNEVDVTVENKGTLPAGPFKVSLSISDGLSEKQSVSGLEAGATTTVQFKWTPRGEDCFINCTYTDTCKYYNFTGVVDCDNAVTELDEMNNATSVDERACYNGYMGDDHLENVAHGTLRGGLLFTTGDGRYGGLYSVGSKISTTYEITIPDGASVELARLNVYYTWYYEREHCPQMKVSITNETTTLCANIPMETRYNDLKCTEPEAAWIFPWGNYVFDLKDYVKGSGNYTVTVERTGGKSFAIAAPGIVLVYEDRNAPNIEYWINEGADILLGGRRYATSSNLAWWECINNATFPASSVTDNVTNVTLGVVTPWGDDAPDDILFFNDVEIGRGVYHGYGNPYSKTINGITMNIGAGGAQVGVNVTNVTALYLNDSENMVSQADDGDNMMPCNAFLVVEYEKEPPFPANVTIKPETLNLNSKGVFTAFISNLSKGNLTDINISTVECEGAPAVDGTIADDNKYVVKFNTQNLTNVSEGDAVVMTVTGKLFNGTEFVGNDTIRVIERPCLDGKSTTEELAVNQSTVNTMELTLLWKNYTKAAYGSVAINDKTNTGFVGSTDGLMHALNLNTGDIVWSYNVGKTIRSTPAIADGKVVFIADDGKVYALDQTDGSEIWNFTMRSGVQGSTHFWSPAIHCDEVYAAANGMFYALDLETGAENWNYKFWPHSPYMLGAMTYSSPAVDAENNLVIFGKRTKVIALDMNTGTLAWERGIDVRYGSPTISHDLVFVGDFARDVVYALNETTGDTVWSKSSIWADMPVTTAEINGNPVAFFTKGYRSPRKICAVNALTGDEIWTHQVSTYMLFSGPAVAKIDDTYVLFAGGGYNRKLYALNAETGALLSEYATPNGRVYGSPAVTEVGGKPTVIFTSTDGNVYAVQTTGNLGKEPYVGPWPKFHRDNRNTGYTCKKIPAVVRIKPETLNLNSSGVFTAFVTLPEHDVAEIDIDTVYCEGAHVLRETIAAVNNGTLIAKFDRKDLRADLPTGDEVEMIVTGALTDGTAFVGSDTICVIAH